MGNNNNGGMLGNNNMMNHNNNGMMNNNNNNGMMGNNSGGMLGNNTNMMNNNNNTNGANLRATVTAGVVHTLQHPPSDCISRVRFSPPQCPIIVLGVTAWDSTCSIWRVDYNKGNQAVTSQPLLQWTHTAPLLDLSISARGVCYYGGCCHTATAWDLSSQAKTVVAQHDLPVSCLTEVCIPQSNMEVLVTGSWDGKLRYWDLRQPATTGGRPNMLKEEILGEPIFALDGQKTTPMLSVATARTVHVFNLNSVMRIAEVKVTDKIKYNVRAVASSPFQDSVAVGSAEGRVAHLPLQGTTPAPLTSRPHMTAASLDLPGGRLSGMTSDNTASVMHQCNFISFHPQAPYIISGGGDGRVQLLNYHKKNTNILEGVKFQNTAGVEEVVPVSAGDVHASGELMATAHSYDWAQGRAGLRGQPVSVQIRPLVMTG
ncbi:mRNA export factor [Angomonas deanei]|nr:mRNA export factor [Angomonas deanei]|eukprot:EPY35951.1 mRNA export factor [Angomonas deanei]